MQRVLADKRMFNRLSLSHTIEMTTHNRESSELKHKIKVFVKQFIGRDIMNLKQTIHPNSPIIICLPSFIY